MTTITEKQAAAELGQAVRNAKLDDLVEFYNELFPDKPVTASSANGDATRLVEKIVGRIESGLEVEEILDLWNVIFPAHHHVWFDEEEGLIHYDEEAQPAGQMD